MRAHRRNNKFGNGQQRERNKRSSAARVFYCISSRRNSTLLCDCYVPQRPSCGLTLLFFNSQPPSLFSLLLFLILISPDLVLTMGPSVSTLRFMCQPSQRMNNCVFASTHSNSHNFYFHKLNQTKAEKERFWSQPRNLGNFYLKLKSALCDLIFVNV